MHNAHWDAWANSGVTTKAKPALAIDIARNPWPLNFFAILSQALCALWSLLRSAAK